MIAGLIPYLIIGAVILSVLGGTYWKGREAGKEVERAQWAPKLESCAKRAEGLESALATQERAVQALKAEGEAKVAKAAAGLASAQKGAQTAKEEAARLRKAAGEEGRKDASCPASEAIQEIRRGLQ